MTAEKRTIWKCHICLDELKLQRKHSPSVSVIQSNSSPLLDEENITKHKVNVPTENSFESLKIDNSDDETENLSSSIIDTDTLNRSCPDLGNNLNDLDYLRSKNENLETELEKANCEIENLLHENYLLKKKNRQSDTNM